MEYIDYKEFLKQSEKVQDNFKIWAESNFKEFDLVKLIDEGCILPIDSVLDTSNDDINVGRVFYLGRCMCWSSIYEPNLVPLFTENHSRKYIEEKGNCIIENISYLKDLKSYKIDLFIKPHDGHTWTRTYFSDLGDDLLKAYWKVAWNTAEI